IEAIQNAMALLRKDPLSAIAGTSVTKAEDFNKPEETGLPRSNVLRYTLSDGAWVTVRPSGTEPKLKLYIGAHAETDAKVNARLDDLMNDMDEKLTMLLGLK
ncbi:MAG: phospho-sugar mutase, partial [Clostridia bacterium]|nr:phospho-sugar mutase [Clostridia bacterium]